jgi:hypothetical protein
VNDIDTRAPHVDRRRRTGTSRLLAIAGACALVTSACVHHGNSNVSLGLKRVAVNLAFKDASKAKPPTVKQVVETQQLVPSVALATSGLPADQFDQPLTDLPSTLPPIQDITFSCPKAPQGAAPDASAPSTINSPPTVGTYFQHNTGTFNLALGALNFGGQYQQHSATDITNVVVTPPAQNSVTLQASPPTIDFDVSQRTFVATITDSYHVTNTEVDLTKITIKTGSAAPTTFTWTPPIKVFGFHAASPWTSAGIDTATGTAMLVQGSLAGEERVDVCGTVYDTWKVVSTEKIVNPQTGYSYQTDNNDPKVYWWGTQFGGLLLQIHENSKTTATATVANAPVPVTFDVNYTGTVDSVQPKRLGSSPGF